MIKRLKIKFVALAMSSLFVLLLFIITGINVINYSSVVRQADTVLSVLSQNKGAFPETFGDKGGRISPHITQETPNESRYFSVVLDQSSNAIQTENGKIASVDKETAVQYALAAANRGKKKGFIKTYRFNSNAEGNTVRIIFLECGRQLNDFFGFLYTSIIMRCGCFIKKGFGLIGQNLFHHFISAVNPVACGGCRYFCKAIGTIRLFVRAIK